VLTDRHHTVFTIGKVPGTDVFAKCPIWGAAMTNVHPLWPDTIQADALAAGQILLDKAAIAKHVDTRERGYIDALQALLPGKQSRRD